MWGMLHTMTLSRMITGGYAMHSISKYDLIRLALILTFGPLNWHQYLAEENRAVREDISDHFRIAIDGTCMTTKTDIDEGAEASALSECVCYKYCVNLLLTWRVESLYSSQARNKVCQS